MLLTIIVPSYNEEEVLPEFHFRLSKVLDKLDCDTRVIYINDGSTDRTGTVMNDLRQHDPRVAVVDLSRNFGKEIAMTAGLDYAEGDAVVVIDAERVLTLSTPNGSAEPEKAHLRREAHTCFTG
jgi:polyisoprenyl-phosphate glycosyltransferase